jgi:hypothetical protein
MIEEMKHRYHIHEDEVEGEDVEVAKTSIVPSRV